MNVTSCYFQDAGKSLKFGATPASAGMRSGYVTQPNGAVVQKSSIRKLPIDRFHAIKK